MFYILVQQDSEGDVFRVKVSNRLEEDYWQCVFSVEDKDFAQVYYLQFCEEANIDAETGYTFGTVSYWEI